jgi:hypothetical protein
MADGSIDFEFEPHKDPSDRNFLSVLRSVPDFLTLEDCEHFFNVILSHFVSRANLTKARGKAILSTITTLLANGIYTSRFIRRRFLSHLPIGLPEYAGGVFDILMLLTTQKPELLDESFVPLFTRQLPLSPRKSLTIIARYGHCFEDLDDPWPLLDLLFTQWEVLATPGTAIDCVSLLVFLCRTFPDFRQPRAKHSWLRICELLDTDDPSVLKTCYAALFAISGIHKIEFLPLRQIIRHLQWPELVEFVLPLLLVCWRIPCDEKILRVLVGLSRRDAAATLVLMKLSGTEQNATFLIENNKWFDLPMPTTLDTLKLVFVAINYRRLRGAVARSPRLVPLLVRGVLEVNVAHMAMVTGIVRRVRMTKKLAAELARTEMFAGFFVKPKGKCDWDLADKTLFDFFRQVAQVTYVPELLSACEVASLQVERDGPMAVEAGEFLVVACRYRRCREVMRNLEIERTYAERTRNRRLAQHAAQLSEALRSR